MGPKKKPDTYDTIKLFFWIAMYGEIFEINSEKLALRADFTRFPHLTSIEQPYERYRNLSVCHCYSPESGTGERHKKHTPTE